MKFCLQVRQLLSCNDTSQMLPQKVRTQLYKEDEGEKISNILKYILEKGKVKTDWNVIENQVVRDIASEERRSCKNFKLP